MGREPHGDAGLINGRVGRWLVTLEALHRSGLLATALAVAMLAVFVSMTTGYMPSPLTKMAEQAVAHDASTQGLLQAIRGLTVEMQRQNRRMVIIECARVTDPGVRAVCLKGDDP